MVWDFVSIYGAKNKRAVTKYILGVQSQGAPMIIQRLAKLILHYTKSKDQSAIANVAVLFSDAELARELLNNDRLYRDLDNIGGEFALRVASRIRNTMEQSPDPIKVETLLELFPQLSFNGASSFLNQFSGNVESASAYLLENPDALSEPQTSSYEDIAKAPKEKFIFGKKTPLELTKQSKSHLETTLRLIYEADEDERDDTYAEAEALEESTPESSKAVDKTEQYLWEMYESSPQLFAKESRKSSARGKMRSVTDWSDEQIEGWARMLERQPKRKQILQQRYMFSGNRFAKKHASFLDQPNNRPNEVQHSDEDTRGSGFSTPRFKSSPKVDGSPKLEGSGTSTPSEVENSGTSTPSKFEGSSTSARRNQQRKEQNKARHGNHNRKAGHAKKMAKGMA
ncbi:hypothetical protein TRVA0_040S00694 [Trichomonascus vanleenenianus]|uniref:Cue3p n=1 Tax=Trichomonascus vanleenenianus TaxID=2268995 RepID=UPI003ECA62EF